MALTVIKRPQGYILESQGSATVTSSSGALFTQIAHGLVTGDFIYIYSVLGSYNGYWYVNKNDNNSFRIKEYATASDQAFINSGSIGYYKSALTHNWNCIHLPIVYKLKSDIWPTNGNDTARSITSFSNYKGYTYINASGDIKTTGTASSFENIILIGTSVDGIYKILNWFSDTNFVINLPYSAGNVLSSGTVQYYYFNYCARIRIYAGISGSHYWAAQKPYTLMTEVKIIPDSNGIITLNISEFIKSKILIIKNDTVKDTLPNNIDAWCNFYITYAESYDDSNMYTVSEFVSSYTDDSGIGAFEGFAVNSKLPFQTISSGALSAYVANRSSPSSPKQKWLTDFSRPVFFAIAGVYFDVSYIRNGTGIGDYIKQDNYNLINGNYKLIQSNINILPNYYDGIYRYQTIGGGSNDRIDLTYYSNAGIQLSETLTIDVNQKCVFNSGYYYLVWLNYLGGYNYWLFNAKRGKKYSIDILNSQTQEQNIFNNWPKSYGQFADSITKQTIRRSKNRITLSTQLLTLAQEEALKGIVSSPLVQLYDYLDVTKSLTNVPKTVLISPDTLDIRQDRDKTLSLSFQVIDTDEIPSQAL